MARMMYERDSSLKNLNIARRHARLCKQTPGGEKYAAAIRPYREALEEKARLVRLAAEAREDAYDDIMVADVNLDNGIRTLFEQCKQHDRQASGNVLATIFPNQRFTDITSLHFTREPDVADQLAARLESLPADIALRGEASKVRELTTLVRQTIERYNTTIRLLKEAEAGEDIAKAQLCRQYEYNYLDARRELGQGNAEKLFPVLESGRTVADTSETAVENKPQFA